MFSTTQQFKKFLIIFNAYHLSWLVYFITFRFFAGELATSPTEEAYRNKTTHVKLFTVLHTVRAIFLFQITCFVRHAKTE